MSKSEQSDKKPRRPASVSNTLTELRDRAQRNVDKLGARLERLHVETEQVRGELLTARAELANLNTALGEREPTTAHGSSADGTLAVASLPA
ncbi:MAG TPA: hypothetical protein VD838_01700, partial [Anaeromyxobacteraceae bacterium]|nr:hypothetical protein [Anaeromyxobacteraceae bacterium]